MRKGTIVFTKQGFTLVEMMIYMGLLGIFLFVLTDLLVSTLDVRSESTSFYSVTQDGEYIQKKISHDVRSSDVITTPGSAGTTSTTLSFTTAAVATTYSIQSGNLTLTQNSQTFALNSNATTVSNFSVTRIGSGSATDTFQISYLIESLTLLRGSPAESKLVQFTIGGR